MFTNQKSQMKTIPYNTPDSEIYPRILRQANCGFFDGLDNPDGSMNAYLDSCRWLIEKFGCIAILTRDVGYHTCGWWKNPDYERCYHLSISFPAGRKPSLERRIVKGFFGYNAHLLWCEPPYSADGQSAGVYHYRLFCDAEWNPIKPRGEVYNTQFTEKGWKSFSELHAIY